MLGGVFLVAAGLLQRAQMGARSARVSVGLTLYDATGGTPALAVADETTDITTYAYTTGTFCNLHPPVTAMPPDAEFGWRIDLKVLPKALDEVTAHVEWRRMWENGHAVGAPRGSSDLTLHPGDRVSLDSVMAPADSGTCRGTRLAVQVGFSPWSGRGGAAPLGVSNGGSFGDGPGIGGAGRGGGSGRMPAGGVANFGGPPSGATIGGAANIANAGEVPTWTATRSAEGMTVWSDRARISAQSQFDPATREVCHVDLWLVHTLADGSEETQHLNVDTLPAAGDFRFAPVVASVPEGTATIGVLGFVEAQRTPAGTEKLSVTLFQLLHTSTGIYANQTNGKIIPMPGNADVVAFDVPGTGALLDRMEEARRGARSSAGGVRNVTGAAAPLFSETPAGDPNALSLLRALSSYKLSLRVRVSR